MRVRPAAMLAMAVLTTSAVPARPAISQEPGAREDTTLAEDRIAEGDRIRFAAPPEFPDLITGRVTSFEDGLLVVNRRRSLGGPASVRFSDLSQLEVVAERKPNTILGLAIGTGVGLALGGLLAWAYCDGADTSCEAGDAALVTVVVAAPFAAIGGVIGSLSPMIVWEEVPLP